MAKPIFLTIIAGFKLLNIMSGNKMNINITGTCNKVNALLDRFCISENLKFYRFLIIYCILAALTLYSFMFLPLLGEEGNYTMSTMEMAYTHRYFVTTVFGTFYGRPPLVNWLMLPLAKLVGWQNIILASRFIVITCSVGTGVVLGFLVKRFTANKCFAWLCVAIFFSGDLLLRRGWLAYSDTHLTFFTFSAMACLWVAIQDRKMWLLIVGLVLLNCGYLSKALTPFGYYAIFYLVLLWRHPNRRFLLHPAVIILHLIAYSFPVIWDHYTAKQYGGMMVEDLFNLNHTPKDILNYFYQILFYRPIELLIHTGPASFIALCFLVLQRRLVSDWQEFKDMTLIALYTGLIIFAGCCLMPLWPEARYYMPAYPLYAIAMAYVIWHAGKRAQQWLQLGLVIYLVVALFLSLWGIAFFQTHMRFAYTLIAKQIATLTEGYPLYALNPQVSQSESIVSLLDGLRMPNQSPLMLPPTNWNNGFAITAADAADQGQLVITYHARTGHNDIRVICRGTACAAAAQRLGHALPVTMTNREVIHHGN